MYNYARTRQYAYDYGHTYELATCEKTSSTHTFLTLKSFNLTSQLTRDVYSPPSEQLQSSLATSQLS